MEGETIPQNLSKLREWVMEDFGLSITKVGIIGSQYHLYGYHRSRDWIMKYGRGHNDYSVKLTRDVGGSGTWVSAMDISLPPTTMKTVSKRILDAMKARDPRVSAVREFYGTVDGTNVIGWDSAVNSWSDSDDSHLTHVHMSFYRSMADNDHSHLRTVLNGGGLTMDVTVTDISLPAIDKIWEWGDAPGGYNMRDHILGAESAANNASKVSNLILAAVKDLNLERIPVQELAIALKPFITEQIKSAISECMGEFEQSMYDAVKVALGRVRIDVEAS